MLSPLRTPLPPPILEAFPPCTFAAKSCHLLLPASSSFVALTFRGTLAGRVGPSETLEGSERVMDAASAEASAAAASGFRNAEAVIVVVLKDGVERPCGGEVTFRFRSGKEEVDGLFGLFVEVVEDEMGLMSREERVSVVAYDLKSTMYTGEEDEPVMEVMRAG